MTISFLLDLNLNVTWRNIKLPNIVQCKQNVTKGTAANAAAVSFIVQGSQLCHLQILEMNFLYSGAGLPVQLNEDSVIAFFNGTKQSGIFFYVWQYLEETYQMHCLVTAGCAWALHNLDSIDSLVLLHSRAEKYLFIS